ncbi:MAG: hypothetical protein PHQ19_01320 [Candidatus Krumholzibacteria bacterium]|nr:hypothetical protein [Candidatus Krumholzibacteria bacterium]
MDRWQIIWLWALGAIFLFLIVFGIIILFQERRCKNLFLAKLNELPNFTRSLEWIDGSHGYGICVDIPGKQLCIFSRDDDNTPILDLYPKDRIRHSTIKNNTWTENNSNVVKPLVGAAVAGVAGGVAVKMLSNDAIIRGSVTLTVYLLNDKNEIFSKDFTTYNESMIIPVQRSCDTYYSGLRKAEALQDAIKRIRSEST